MHRGGSRRRVLRAAAAGTGVALAGCLLGDSASGDDVDSYRDQLSTYQDVAEAAAAGFEMATPYVHTPEGALGVPFFNYATGEPSPTEPNGLFYQLDEDGTFRLLGVKWFVRVEDADERPTMFGQEFLGPIPDETGSIAEHYALHAWLFADNPDGTFHRYHTGLEPPAYLAELATVWSALTPYYNNDARAEADGYVNTEACVETEDGGYSIPFINPERTGTDPTAPGVLLYRFSSNWNYRLVGAEWYVAAEAADEPPSMFGRPFHDAREGHSPEADQPRHYGLHAWAFMANPDGIFAPFNRLLGC